MDFTLTKELIGEYSYSTVKETRQICKDVVINGRTYTKYGEETATTIIALQYKVYNPSVKRSEYITLMGVARQNPGDIVLNIEEGYEVAKTNALINPVMTIKSQVAYTKLQLDNFMRCYAHTLPVEFVKTKEEILALGADLSYYNRNTARPNDYYEHYYSDYKKIFNK